MDYLDDTIAAISTPMGEGGIGIVRLSGRDAVAIADAVFVSPKGKKLSGAKSHTLTYGVVIDPATGRKIDEVLVAVMRAPHTYTREDVVEINCHGGILPLKTTLQLLLHQGARLAGSGEFTRRAFLNGRIDLSQAEAVIDVIRAKTDQAERLAFQQLEGRLSKRMTELQATITGFCAHIEAYIDFPEEEIEAATKDDIIGSLRTTTAELHKLSNGYEEGKFFREGVSAAIVGKPNVGKSSLLNALLEKDRAIVTDLPGTTRDIIEDYLNINGLPLRIMDTAGIRETHNLAEMEGVKRSLKAIDGADLIIAVLDASRPLDAADRELIERIKNKKSVVVINKIDREIPGFGSVVPGDALQTAPVKVSAVTGHGIDELKNAIYSLCIAPDSPLDHEDLLITNMRHKHAIDSAIESLKRAEESLSNNEPLEVTALFLRESLNHLGAIIGVVTTDDILNRIFSEFCIGK